jgi:hypothetical protein
VRRSTLRHAPSVSLILTMTFPKYVVERIGAKVNKTHHGCLAGALVPLPPSFECVSEADEIVR